MSAAHLVVKDETVAVLAVNGGVGHVTKSAHVSREELFRDGIGHSVQPDTVGWH